MSKFKFELNKAGVRELMKSAEMQSVLNKEAKRVQSTCGRGYDVEPYVEETRAVAEVRAVSFRARRKNLKENTLLKALR